jgi:phospholipase/carboxylesterase
MSEHRFHTGAESGVPYVYRAGETDYALHILMLHGWSGDEKVMWVLESVLPDAAPVAALRGLFPVDQDGYEWTDREASIDTTIMDFDSARRAVEETLETLALEHGFNPERLVLMGFSQGAALSFALAELLEQAPRAIVALAGYYPAGDSSRIKQIPVFWGHGTSDELVPIDRARRDVAMLEAIGTDITYCEADVGHKLGIECTRGLKHWLREIAVADGA